MFTICLHIDLKKGSSHAQAFVPSVKQVPSSFHYQTLFFKQYCVINPAETSS
jgi:hypothetical protein